MISQKANGVFSSKTSLATALLTATLASGAAGQSVQKSEVIDVSKVFKMEVQLTPRTDPANPASRTVEVHCDKLELGSNNYPILSGSFVDQFDIAPMRPKNTTGDEAAQGSLALQHIGGEVPVSHQYCVAHAETYSGEAKRDRGRENRPYSFVVNGNQYNTSVPMTDSRYCAPEAARSFCTIQTDDDARISPVYKLLTNGDVILDRNELQKVENPPGPYNP